MEIIWKCFLNAYLDIKFDTHLPWLFVGWKFIQKTKLFQLSQNVIRRSLKIICFRRSHYSCHGSKWNSKISKSDTNIWQKIFNFLVSPKQNVPVKGGWLPKVGPTVSNFGRGWSNTEGGDIFGQWQTEKWWIQDQAAPWVELGQICNLFF